MGGDNFGDGEQPKFLVVELFHGAFCPDIAGV